MAETVPGQPYGVAAEQKRAMGVVPMASGRQAPPRLDAPSARPSEPVQAGLPSGPGPGPEALGGMDGGQLTRATLQALMRRYPSPTIRRLLMDMELRR
jgi:hypothetical protein